MTKKYPNIPITAGSLYHSILLGLVEKAIKTNKEGYMMKSHYENIYKILKESMDKNDSTPTDIEDPNIEGFG